MSPADVGYLTQWEKANSFTVDFAFNGGGSADWMSDHDATSDPLLTSVLANQSSLRFINHTWDHPFVGCVQNVSVVPWKCRTDASGNPVWVDQATIRSAIQQNIDWAKQQGLTIDPGELVTGEHSGLVTLPQQLTDNPNLAPALAATGIKWTGSDASRESGQRPVGAATLTVPRYPMNVFYNAGHTNEEVDEYNWIYTSKADGGSGICESSAYPPACLPARHQHRVRLVHRAAGDEDRPRARAEQRPAAALHPPVQLRRGPDRLPGARLDPEHLQEPLRRQHARGEPAGEPDRRRAAEAFRLERGGLGQAR